MTERTSSPRGHGNAVVGQSGGPTAAINSSLAGIVQAALDRPEIGGVYGMLGAIKGLIDGRLVDLGQESPETIASSDRTITTASPTRFASTTSATSTT
jgi:6-phosphofructokinase 1